MLINMTDVFTEEEKSVVKEVPLELTSICFQGEDFRILEKSPVTLTLTNTGQGRASIEAEATVKVELKCDRMPSGSNKGIYTSVFNSGGIARCGG